VVRTLVDESQAGGSYRVTWEGKDDRGKRASSGIYFSVLDVGGKRQTRKLALLK
jgi:flagellar hook assembly protein FlgD